MRPAPVNWLSEGIGESANVLTMPPNLQRLLIEDDASMQTALPGLDATVRLPLATGVPAMVQNRV